ncbi:methyltransferase [Streptomyces sp. NPDC046197]|uniref:methyltransferase n=1 Tax=Streptomyces sp. NPDC046197 TaxID=3154337 RepID=UPI0033D115EE
MTDRNQSAVSSPVTDPAAHRELLGVLTGSWTAQALYAVTALGVPDVLAGGHRSAAEIADSCAADADTMHRVLRALASVGLFEQRGEDVFGLTSASTLLRSDVPRSLRDTALMLGEEVHRSLGGLVDALRSGTPAFDHVHGKPMYAYLEEHPDVARTFNAALGSRAAVPAAWAQVDLGGVETVVDVGGGNGNLLAEVLAERPGLRGVLLELPEAVAQARTRFAGAGLADRVTLAEGSFFDRVPAGGDLYVLSRCLHNWSDERALDILRTVRAALPAGGRLVILEKIIPSGPGPSPAKLYDLLMLTMVEGRNRTEAEYRALAEKAGFRPTAVHPAPVSDPGGESAVEALAA